MRRRSAPMRSRRPTQRGRSSVGPTACWAQRCPLCPSVAPEGTRRMPCVPRPVQMSCGKDGRAVQRKTTKARTRAARANAFTHAHARTYTRTRTHAPAHTLAPAYEPHGDVDGRALETRSSVARQVKLVDDDDGGASKVSSSATSFPVSDFTKTAGKGQVTAPIAQCSSRARTWRSAAVRDGQPPLHSSGGRRHASGSIQNSRCIRCHGTCNHTLHRFVCVYVHECVSASEQSCVHACVRASV